jgi:N-acyl-D-amino-acid deacylase
LVDYHVRADDAAVDQAAVRAAIEKALERLETGASNYLTHRDCFSCHHQALPVVAMVSARARGFDIDPEVIAEQAEFSRMWFDSKVKGMRQGKDVPGGDITAGYALWALGEAGTDGGETTEAMIQFLQVRQKPEGNWVSSSDRPPMETSEFTATAFSVGALAGRFATEQAALLSLMKAQAATWLERAEPQSTEDLAMRLWGLKLAGRGDAELALYRESLLKAQREDGGWGQLPEMPSDAYATGLALFVLSETGLSADGPSYRRGVAWLLEYQRDDGAWIVETRSKPVQTYFDNGDPGGKSQFISMAATSWATLSLLATIEP